MTPPPNHKIHRFENGSYTIARNDSGDTMHSRIGAWEEAHKLYIEQSSLKIKLSTPSTQPLVIWDVGMGIAANALGALECAQSLNTQGHLQRPLIIHSFENNLEGLTIALGDVKKFPFMERNLPQLLTLLKHNHWHSSNPLPSKITWHLHHADFFQCIQSSTTPAPDLIFYDFYAPASAPKLWSVDSFRALKNAMHGSHALLYTYASSTPARAALLLAGWHLTRGTSTSAKQDTTVASLIRTAETKAYGQEWWEHYLRSSKKTPLGFEGTEAQAHELLKKILSTE